MDKLVKQIATTLKERGETLSLAESCTGGLVSSKLTEYPGISEVYLGGVVGYANSAKEKFLNVSSESLKKFGAVSAEVALEMAVGIRDQLDSTWAVSVTGVAGPGGGSAEKPVGLVFFGLVGPQIEQTARKQFQGSRVEIQNQAARFALELLLAEFEA